MIHPQNEKTVVIEQGIAVTTDATSSVVVDTLGFDYVVIESYNIVSSNTSSVDKWTSATLGQATTTDISNATTIVGATGTTNATATASQFVLANNRDTTYGSVMRFEVALVDKERYLHLTREAPASHSTISTIARLSRGGESPKTKALRGVNALCTLL